EAAQKSKVRWAIEGDENTNFFHDILNSKCSQLAICGTLLDGEWIVNPLAVKSVFRKYFSTEFSSRVSPRICFADQFTNRLSFGQRADLERNVSNEEIKSAVWDCGTNKSPGPIGFTFKFFHRYLKLLQHDIVVAVKEFFASGSFPPGCNSSFITLIPKFHDAKVIKDYRPICLIRSLYTIIAKILANRLSFVISGLISNLQSTFVSNRQILDGPFVLGMSISPQSRNRTGTVPVPYRFSVYGTVPGLRNKWCGWINGCLNSAMGSVLVNGSPALEFQFYKGLKQGDPLSPILFILIMESLHLSFSKVTNEGLFSGIPIDSSLTLSHLFFVDDDIFVGKWDSLNICTIVNLFKCFHLASGLKIKFHKSKLMGIGTRPEEVDAAATIMGCSIFTTPFVHLGVKVGGAMSRIKSWDDVVAKVSSRVSKW
ncbi:RNA-directed DNA polymerase, eukaryota, partial [Tanacetum coccineum]